MIDRGWSDPVHDLRIRQNDLPPGYRKPDPTISLLTNHPVCWRIIEVMTQSPFADRFPNHFASSSLSPQSSEWGGGGKTSNDGMSCHPRDSRECFRRFSQGLPNNPIVSRIPTGSERSDSGSAVGDRV